MPFNDISDPKHLVAIAAVLNDICLAAGIELRTPEGEDTARRLMHLHRVGCHTETDLKKTLDELTRQAWRA